MSGVILLLDDDIVTLGFLESVLTGAGFSCCTIADPKQALSIVCARPDIALVLSDIYMPDMTGLQFAEQLRSLNLTWPAPAVLLLTAHPTLQSAVDALRLGAIDFLAKPVLPSELVRVVTRVMDRVLRNRTEYASRKPDVELIIRQAEEIAGALRRLTQPADPPAPPSLVVYSSGGADKPVVNTPTIHSQWLKGRVSVLQAIDGLRKLRRHYDDHKLDDVAWDLLLEILLAEQKHIRLSVSALTISVQGVSSTTSLRRLTELTERNYIERIPDALDARREFVQLTSKARALLADYLQHADACLMDLRPSEQPKVRLAEPAR